MKNYKILSKVETSNTELWINLYEEGKYPSWTKEDHEVAKCNLQFTNLLLQINMEDCENKGVEFDRVFKVFKHLSR